MNYVQILLEDGLREVQQQKLELIALTGNEAPKEIRKINLIEMQLEQQLTFNKRDKILDVDIKIIKRLYIKGYTHNEIATIYNVSQSTITKNIK
jgi:DNA-directed RNA polymerase specialized sigma subunit